MKPIRVAASFICAVSLAFVLAVPASFAQEDNAATPLNLAGGLRELAEWHRTLPAASTPTQRQAALRARISAVFGDRVKLDETGRVVVDVYLDGTVPAADVRRRLVALGATVFAEHLPAPDSGRPVPQGLLSAYLPVGVAATAGRLPGVGGAALVRRPFRRVGLVTSQGVGVMRADLVNDLGFTGSGITVGAISDSFNTRYLPTSSRSAEADVASGDLPTQNTMPLFENPPEGRATTVDVLDDSLGGTDEGRAMLQIVHDVAPNSALAFSTCGETETTMAAAIRALRNSANCDIIVDDIGYSSEPFFSDGIIADAIDEVVNTPGPNGKRMVYFSAAGNDGSTGYEADFAAVSDVDVRVNRAGAGNLNFSDVPSQFTAGGFHNFAVANGDGGVSVVQKIFVSSSVSSLGFPEITLQWPDPVGDTKRITTDYNILVFNADGEWLGNRTKFPGNGLAFTVEGGTFDSYTFGLPIELVILPLGADRTQTATYQIVITRRAPKANVAPVDRFRYITSSRFFGFTVTGNYLRNDIPTVFGHPGARGCIAVAAHPYNDPGTPEDFTSWGPVSIFFDHAGNRLAEPEVRLQPAVAAPDGADTTFFSPGFDSDLDGFPNFFGTSAAAPHAAAVGALLLQAGGGPGSVSAARIRDLLQASPAEHDLDPFFSTASVDAAEGSRVSLAARGTTADNAGVATDFFTLRYEAGPAGSILRTVTIDLLPTGLKFNADNITGFPFTIGSTVGVNPKSVTAEVKTPIGAKSAAATNSQLVVTIADKSFVPGALLTFGVGRSDVVTGSSANSADRLENAAVAIAIQPKTGAKMNASGAFRNTVGTGFNPVDGFGLIDARKALELLQTTPAHPAFFNGEVALSNDIYYLQFPNNGNIFGYYAYLSDPRFIYHFDLGYEYLVEAKDSANGLYFYDFASSSWFYTSPSFVFPYLYDFSLNAFLYYFPDQNHPGRYTSNPRYFYNFSTGQVITK